MRVLFVELLSHPIAKHFAYFSESVAMFTNEINVHNNPELARQFAERLQERTGMILVWNVDQEWEAPPALPFFNEWVKTMRETWQDGLVLRYQDEPQETLWLLHTKAPKFSLGVPDFNAFNLKAYAILAGFLEIVFAIFAAYFAALYLKRPLKELIEGAESIGRDIRSKEIKPSGPTEIREVAEAMNTMRDDINKMSNKQEQLLAGISHDLRTPLTRLRLTTELLKTGSTQHIKDMNDDIEEMNQVLNQFIKLTRYNIEENEPWQIGDITPLLQDVEKKYQRINIDLNFLLDPLPPIRYKAMFLRRLLYNLIDNGVEHGSGKVSVIAKYANNYLELCVTDEGSGFKQSKEKLNAYSDLNEEQVYGDGLGLTILQRIAKIHEGKLILCNKPEGGAKVVLYLKAYA
jgi:two-component system osmolarity sensor histidine kinase EnvZ